jgi:imidazolonepropionase-like amidohydrolase
MVLTRALLWISGLTALLCCSLTAMQQRPPAAGSDALKSASPGTRQESVAGSEMFPPGGTFLVRNVRIFDGTRVIRANAVLVEEGKIAKVGNRLPTPANIPIVDGTGCTLLPGLIDSHVHSYIRAALQQELLFGVTTELDMMNPPDFAMPIQKAQAEGKERDLADVFTAGWGATAPGAHGTEGEGSVRVPTISRPEEAQAWVDARIAEGSNYIKIIYGSRDSRPSLTKETMAALVKAAHKRGKIAVAHAWTYETTRDAMEAGVDGLVHLFADRAPEPGFEREMARRRIFVLPTLTIVDSWNEPKGASLATDPDLAPYLTKYPVGNLKETIVGKYRLNLPLKLEHANTALRALLAARVPVLAGSDAPNPGTWYGASLHREMELLVQAGMTPLEALAAATSVPARQFRLKDRGRIAPGLRADLLLVKGDPTQNIRDTRRIVAVWKRGTAVDRAVLKDTWENALLGFQPKSVSDLITYEVQDLTSKFLKFYEAAQGADPERRWQLWKELYNFAAVPPIPEGQQMARRLLDEAWAKYPGVLDRVRRGAEGMQPAPRPVLERAARLLALDKPLRVRLRAYVGGLENNAFASGRDGVQIVSLPVEMEAARRALVMPHEFTHAIHVVTAGLSGGWERSVAELVLQEGLAMRATQALKPGHPDWIYTEGGANWLAECHKRREEILKGIEPHLSDSNSATVARFTVGTGTSGLGREAYYVGWLVVDTLLKRGMTLAQVAHIPQKEIVAVVRTAIRELGGIGQPP